MKILCLCCVIILGEGNAEENPDAVVTFEGSQKAGSVYVMKDEAGNVVGSWTVGNNFSHLKVCLNLKGENSLVECLNRRGLSFPKEM